MAQAHQSKRVAVTGSTGMIGSHLVAELFKAGYEEIVLPVRDKSKVERIRRAFELQGLPFDENRFNILEMHLTDSAALARAFEGVDTVFHCAAVILSSELDAEGVIRNNTELAKGVANAAITAGVNRILHTSSIIVLCPKGYGHIVTEDDPPHAEPDSSAYQRSKYSADMEMERVRKAGVELITLYPAVVLGEGDWSLNGSSALVPFLTKGIPFYADGVMAYADVRDVARAYVTLDNCSGAVGRGFIISGANLSYRELLTYGAEASGKRKPFIRAGKGLLFTAYYLMRMLIRLGLMKDRGVTKNNLGSVLYGNRYMGTEIEKICNFEYSPIKLTIERVVGNYLSENRKK